MWGSAIMTWPTRVTHQKPTHSRWPLIVFIFLFFLLLSPGGLLYTPRQVSKPSSEKMSFIWSPSSHSIFLSLNFFLGHCSRYDEKSTNNDIALLKLKQKIDFKKYSGTVTPVCLPDLPRKYYGELVSEMLESVVVLQQNQNDDTLCCCSIIYI